MAKLDPQSLSGTIVIVAPHMDDEALACGGLIARLPHKDCVHIIYATDGMRSPAPVIAGRDKISQDLGRTRMRESAEAMGMLGVPAGNLEFLCLPEAHLSEHVDALGLLLREKLRELAPKHIFVPFRYDRHPDHLAVNHAIMEAVRQGNVQAQLIEYFVYYRWRLMPKGDIRKYIRSQLLFELDISDVAHQKRQALGCYTSQTTIYYPWQTRPILTSKLLDEECHNPELFLIADTSSTGAAVFFESTLLIRLVHRLEPVLLRWKYLAGARWNRILNSHARRSG